MSHDLYSKYAYLYSEIANDRNFLQELINLKAFDIPVNGIFVELFAGPAYHSISLLNSGWMGTVISIDNSQEMKKVAKKRGFRGTYLCSDAVSGLVNIKNADLICIPRYSIVLVDFEYTRRLFHQVSKSLSKDGVFFLEIHKDANINHQLYVSGNWEKLGIHKRIVKTSIGIVECIWPYKTEIIDLDEKIVDMSVKFSITKENHPLDTFVFTSREHLYTKDDLLSLANEVGFIEASDKSFETNDSYFLALIFKQYENLERNNDTGSKTQEKLAQLRLKSFTRIFDISSNNKRAEQLAKSGIDPVTHNSPLSLHVYNLL